MLTRIVYLAEYFLPGGGENDDFVERGIFSEESCAIEFLLNVVNEELSKNFKSWPEMSHWFRVYETTPPYLWNEELEKEYPSYPGSISLVPMEVQKCN